MSFVHLDVKSCYSMLRGGSTPSALLEKAAAEGMKAMALTDINNLHGAVRFVKEARNRGIKPVIGAEIRHNGLSAVILAKNGGGYSRVCEIATSRKLEEKDFNLSRELSDETEDLFILSSHPRLLKELRFHPGMFVNMVHTGNNIKRLRELYYLSRELEIPCVATNNVYFARPEDHHVHRVLAGIRTNTSLSSLPRDGAVSGRFYLKTAREMRELFGHFPEALRNSVKIAEQCSGGEPERGKLRFPRFPVPEGENKDSLLMKTCLKGLRERYPNPSSEVTRRLIRELEVITGLGFSSYFLAVWDIAREARERGYPLIGRGSAANSLVSYVLYLTDVDPIRYGLYFERFLNKERKTPPDIDLDFGREDRDKLVEYVTEKYGPERVATIGSFNSFALRSAFRETGKVMGLSTKQVNKISKRLPRSCARDLGRLESVMPGIKSLPLDEEPYRSIIKTAAVIDGYPRHLSVHPGGTVISPDRMTDFLPLERAAKGVVVTQYDMYDVEELGLIKIDLLCQRSLTVYADTVREVGRKYGAGPDIEDPEKACRDRETRKLIKEGNTIGCFYIESPAMRGLLKKLEVDNFEMLTAASSVIRPGVSASGMDRQYIKRHRGLEKTEYLHPGMAEILEETYGIMIYQEDVIKVCHLMAGMSLADADLLRRAMSGKMRSEKAIAKLAGKFMEGCDRNGLTRTVAEELWRQIKTFARYSFCKAHSAGYAQLSFKVARLKAHYPAEFMAAVLSNMGGFYGTHVYIEEARRLGVKVLPPDVNESATGFTVSENSLRPGLRSVKDLSRKAVESIIEIRKNGAFRSLAGFCRRVRIDIKETENLVLCGAFDFLGRNRPELLWELKAVFPERGDRSGKNGLLDTEREFSVEIPEITDYSLAMKLSLEEEILGFTVTAHPLEPFRKRIEEDGLTTSSFLSRIAGKRAGIMGITAASKKVRTAGGYMMFLTLWDLDGPAECTLFPKTFMKYGRLLHEKGPYIAEGRVEDDLGFPSLTVDSLERAGDL